MGSFLSPIPNINQHQTLTKIGMMTTSMFPSPKLLRWTQQVVTTTMSMEAMTMDLQQPSILCLARNIWVVSVIIELK